MFFIYSLFSRSFFPTSARIFVPNSQMTDSTWPAFNLQGNLKNAISKILTFKKTGRTFTLSRSRDSQYFVSASSICCLPFSYQILMFSFWQKSQKRGKNWGTKKLQTFATKTAFWRGRRPGDNSQRASHCAKLINFLYSPLNERQNSRKSRLTCSVKIAFIAERSKAPLGVYLRLSWDSQASSLTIDQWWCLRIPR